MKNLLFFLAIISLSSSCTKKELVDTGAVIMEKPVDLGVVGKYKMIEYLLDPGDGSGTFQPITSNVIVELHSNGTVTSNGDLCTGMPSNTPTNGTYSLTDWIITTANCTDLTFEIFGPNLIVDYPCIEPCRGKLLKQ